MIDFQRPYKVLLVDKSLPCDNFRQYNDDPLNIFDSIMMAL